MSGTAQSLHNNAAGTMAYEVIDSKELAQRWSVPVSWVRDQVRKRADDPIPHVRLGRYVRFEWDSPQLRDWWARHRKGFKR
jgi:hypothetical protein